MAYEHILFDVTDGVATLTINRPERMNALHIGVIAEMIDAVDKIRDGLVDARVLLMTGTGRAFCSGADLAGGGAGGGGGGSGPVSVAGRPARANPQAACRAGGARVPGRGRGCRAWCFPSRRGRIPCR